MDAVRFDVADKNIKSIDELLEETNSNWIATSEELQTCGGIGADGSIVEGVVVPNKRAIIRQDTRSVLGVVGKNYHPVQNSQAFAFFDAICQQENATYQYLYEVDGGKRIIAQAKMDNSFEARAGDVVDNYITLVNSFDGSSPVLAYFTTNRLFCKNQLTASLRNATNKVSIRHTGSIQDRMHDAAIVMAKSAKFFTLFEDNCKILAQKAADKQMVEQFMNSVFGETDPEAKTRKRENTKERVGELFEAGMGNNGSSLWDLVNGVTEWVDHKRSNKDASRLASAITGSGFKLKEDAFHAAMSLV